MVMASLPAVVSIKVNRVRAFDTASAGTVQATGFVVDAERGYIMTNRHVAGPGPLVADAIFVNNEEVPLRVAYYDPIHDFAIMKFDPAAVKHMDIVPLQLAPEEAAVGVDIVIIGNNAGEKSSIHKSTLARCDRNAPLYNRNGYNDFNTFYMHSASGTSGGSSGSPVLNSHGRAIALNAGGKAGTAAAFFLPLDRAARALRLLQAGEPVTRGTLQAVCLHQPFDEARRLGLPDSEEASVRASDPDSRGMLVVSEVVPSGPADGKMQPGDIVLRVGGQLCSSFVLLEEQLDASVGAALAVDVCRGGVVRQVELTVDDLHALTPARFAEVGGGVVNELSYQQARNHGIPPRGVYVAHPGYMLRQAKLARGCIIDAVGGVPTPDLDSFIRVMAGKRHGETATVRYYDISQRSHVRLSSLTMDRKWFAPAVYQRSDPRYAGTEGGWESVDLPPPPDSPKPPAAVSPPAVVPAAADADASPPSSPPPPLHASPAAAAPKEMDATVWLKTESGVWQGTPTELTPTESAAAAAASTAATATAAAAAAATATTNAATSTAATSAAATQTSAAESPPRKRHRKPSSGKTKESSVNVSHTLAPALVTVDFTRPFSIDGETGMRYRGCGLVLDSTRGLVAVDRNTVTSTLGDVSVTVGDAAGATQATMPATVLYVHPLHNFALVKYDPAALPSGVRVASAVLDTPASTRMTTGAACWLVGLKSGLNEEFDPSRRVDHVARKTRVANTGWIKLPLPNPPRYQLSNVETLGLEVAPSLDGGVIANSSGGVLALWTSCAYQSAPSQLSQVYRGLPIHHLAAAASAAAAGCQPPHYCSLGATLEPISTAAARRLGVSDELLPWTSTAAAAAAAPSAAAAAAAPAAAASSAGGGGAATSVTKQGNSVLCVTHMQSNSPARHSLRGGDLLVGIDGTPIHSHHLAEAALQGKATVDVQIVRDGKPMSMRCETLKHDGLGTTRVLGWAGLLLQSAPDAVQSQRDMPAGGGVYASYRYFGSPSSRYDLSPTSHIVEVDSQPTPDLEAFLRCTRQKKDGEVLRIKYVDLEGRQRVTTLKLDLKYWPTFLLERDAASGEWERHML